MNLFPSPRSGWLKERKQKLLPAACHLPSAREIDPFLYSDYSAILFYFIVPAARVLYVQYDRYTVACHTWLYVCRCTRICYFSMTKHARGCRFVSVRVPVACLPSFLFWGAHVRVSPQYVWVFSTHPAQKFIFSTKRMENVRRCAWFGTPEVS